MGIVILAWIPTVISGNLPVTDGSMAGSSANHIVGDAPVITGEMTASISIPAWLRGIWPVEYPHHHEMPVIGLAGSLVGHNRNNVISSPLPVFEDPRNVGDTGIVGGAYLSATNNHISIAGYLPVTNGSLFGASSLAGGLPIVAGEISARVIISSRVDGNLVSIGAGSLDTGPRLSSGLVVISGQIKGTVGRQATMSGPLQAMGKISNIFAKVEILANISGDYNLPVLSGRFSTGKDNYNYLAGDLPALALSYGSMRELRGIRSELKARSLSVVVGSLSASLVSQGELSGDLVIVDKMSTIYSGSADDQRVLQNIRGEVR